MVLSFCKKKMNKWVQVAKLGNLADLNICYKRISETGSFCRTHLWIPLYARCFIISGSRGVIGSSLNIKFIICTLLINLKSTTFWIRVKIVRVLLLFNKMTKLGWRDGVDHLVFQQKLHVISRDSFKNHKIQRCLYF